MSAGNAINCLVTITLIEMMVAVGLGVAWVDVTAVMRNYSLLVRAILANFVCVPIVTLVLLTIFQANRFVMIGFLVLAVCPGAPYGPPLASIAKGSTTAAVGLMAILAALSAALSPVAIAIILPRIAGDVSIDALRLVGTLMITQLLPLGAGLAVRNRYPALAGRLLAPAVALSKLLNVVMLIAILTIQFPHLAEIRPRAFLGMTVLLVFSLAIGWLWGGPDDRLRRTLAITTALRNVGVGLAIVGGSFPDTPALSAVVAYGLFGILITAAIAAMWGHGSAKTWPKEDLTARNSIADSESKLSPIDQSDGGEAMNGHLTPTAEEFPQETSTGFDRKPSATLFVDRSSQQWIVLDQLGRFWSLPHLADSWQYRQVFEPTDETELERVPGHYKQMLGIPI